jgi:hypothetical protein
MDGHLRNGLPVRTEVRMTRLRMTLFAVAAALATVLLSGCGEVAVRFVRQ